MSIIEEIIGVAFKIITPTWPPQIVSWDTENSEFHKLSVAQLNDIAKVHMKKFNAEHNLKGDFALDSDFHFVDERVVMRISSSVTKEEFYLEDFRKYIRKEMEKLNHQTPTNFVMDDVLSREGDSWIDLDKEDIELALNEEVKKFNDKSKNLLVKVTTGEYNDMSFYCYGYDKICSRI